MFLINKLEYLVFNTAQIDKMRDYYERILGMTLIEGSPEDEVWLGKNSNIPELILRKSEKASLGEAGFSVLGEDELREIKFRLQVRGIEHEESESELFGKTLSFKDRDGHPLRVHLLNNVSAEVTKRVPRTGPQLGRIQHVTYASPAPIELANFYEGVLDFRISDKVEGNKFVWLRTDPDHHTVAAAAHVEAGLDHYAFELPDWESFKIWCDHLAEEDVEVVWGPGRHGPGNNLFIFTLDPDGNRIEYSAEMEKFRDKYMEFTPRLWKESAQTVNLWGVGAPWARKLPETADNVH
ncbi:MAG TPA: VOC family protein [Ureibacillus sp.]|nr:VOC family protein [Ureibacillus sp.]